jgi:hypothetical protein
VDAARAPQPCRDGAPSSAPACASDRELRARHLRAASSEAGRLVARLTAAESVVDGITDIRWSDDDDLDRRIKAGDPVAALDAITLAIDELRTVARWLETHFALRGM